MQVNFNPNISFKAQPVAQKPVSQVQTAPAPVKKSGSVKEDIGKIAKFFTTLSEMTKATVKAVGYGAATAGTFLAGSWLFSALPNGFRKGHSLKRVFTHPMKSIGIKGKVLAGIATAIVAGYQLVKGKLSANQRTANVDHQLHIGHREG